MYICGDKDECSYVIFSTNDAPTNDDVSAEQNHKLVR